MDASKDIKNEGELRRRKGGESCIIKEGVERDL
jgi:hypothetical protein